LGDWGEKKLFEIREPQKKRTTDGHAKKMTLAPTDVAKQKSQTPRKTEKNHRGFEKGGGKRATAFGSAIKRGGEMNLREKRKKKCAATKKRNE